MASSAVVEKSNEQKVFATEEFPQLEVAIAKPRNAKMIRLTIRTVRSLYSAVSDTWKFAT